MDEVDYVERAKKRIRVVLDEEHAVIGLELEARIAEAGYQDYDDNINPHHISTALRQLTEQGEIVRIAESTRGGHHIETIQPADQRRRATAIATAAARKRLLYGRYLGWAQGTKRYPHGLLGPAGERAVRSGLLLSGGIQPVHADAGAVQQLLNVRLPGPVDSAGYVVPLRNGLPEQPIVVLVEVKNIRGWIYPQSAELYQVLDKARLLQENHPDQRILPVFVCRRAHLTTFWMAQQLGFMVIELNVQFAGDVEEAGMHEVRNELHFQDLSHGNGPALRVRDRFQRTVPEHGVRIATDWRRTATNPRLATLITSLRQSKGNDRHPLMTALRAQVQAEGHQGF